MDDMTSSPYPPFDGVEPYGTVRSVADERVHRKRMCALGYRIFGAMRWGMLGDGHISARDPEWTDHFWLLDWGVPFAEDRKSTRLNSSHTVISYAVFCLK